jgi:hypothetical protein
MRKPTKRLVMVVVISLVAATLALPGTAWAPPPFTIEPGKDSQVFRPETPGYQIKKNQDQVEEYKKVPPPQQEADQKKVQDKQGKEADKK